MSDSPPGRPASVRRSFKWTEKQTFSVLLIAPSVLVLFGFQIIPILVGANVSFRDWMLHNPKKTWVGLDHYIYVLTDKVFLTMVLPNTFLLLFLEVSLALVIGFAMALYLHRGLPGRSIVQTVFMVPLMVAPVVAAIMFAWMFNDQFGVVNQVMALLGLPPVAWMAHRWTAFSVILITDIWLYAPWYMILLFAGLQSLPKEPFEAAQIDGATRWTVLRKLTIPMLRPIMVVCIVIRSIDAFRVFDQVWTLTSGGPARTTEMFSLYAYMEAFSFDNYGRGSAAAMIGAVIIVVVAWFIFKALNRWAEVSR